MELSAEERQRRSDLANTLVAEGKIGGARPGAGRPRKKRAAEFVAEAAREEATSIIDAFKNAVSNGRTMEKVLAAEKWLSIENKETELQLKEDRQYDQMSRDELIDGLAQTIANLQAGGAIPENFVEGTAVEVEQVELPTEVEEIAPEDWGDR